MIGFLIVVMCIFAAWVSYDSGLFVIALLNAILAVWSFGVMSNFANPLEAPTWASTALFVTMIGGIGFIVVAYV